MDISYRHIFILCAFSFWAGVLLAQSDGKPERTPEQEAAKQTEAMQRELDLTPEQVVLIHEINLKYAKERQETDTRTEAMKRMLRKNEDYKRVLTEEQYKYLQSKRVERRTRPLNNAPDRPEASPQAENAAPATSNEAASIQINDIGTQPADTNE